MNKFGMVALATTMLLTSACMGGISSKRLASSDRIETAVMNPPPPSPEQCSRARWVSNNSQDLAQSDKDRVNIILARCAVATIR